MTAATQARERLGLSPDAAARRLRISPRYLRAVELHGDANYSLAERMAHLYQCPMDNFLYANTQGGETPKTTAPAVRRRQGQPTKQKSRSRSGERLSSNETDRAA